MDKNPLYRLPSLKKLEVEKEENIKLVADTAGPPTSMNIPLGGSGGGDVVRTYEESDRLKKAPISPLPPFSPIPQTRASFAVSTSDVEDSPKEGPKVILASERFHRSTTSIGQAQALNQAQSAHGKKVSKKGGNLRIKLYIAFAVMEAIMCCSLILAAYAGQKACRQMYQESARDTLGSVSASYTKKVDQIMDILMGLEFDSLVQTFIQSGTAYTKEVEVLELLRHGSDSYEIEFLSILDSNFTILASSNTVHKGEYFNPENIVTEAKNLGGDPIWTHGIISYEDLKKEGSQLYRDRETGYEMALYNTHPLETKLSSVIRWAAMPVHPLDFATGETNENGGPLAYVIAGDVINGKSSSSVLVSKMLSGSSGVYERPSSGSSEDWKQAGAYTSLNVKSPKGGDHSVEHIMAARLDPNFVIPLSLSDQRSMEDLYAVGTISSMSTKEFGFAATLQSTTGADSVGYASVSQPYVLLTRTVAITASVDIPVTAWCAVSILIVDLGALLLATYLFLSPLEKMGSRIRKGGTVSADFVRGLARRTKYGVFIAVLLGAGFAIAVLYYKHFIGIVDTVARARSRVEPGAQVLAWRRDIDRVARVSKLLQRSGIADSVSNMNDTTLVRAGVTALQRLLVVETMEYANVIGPEGNILFSANPASEPNHKGTYFDPSSIVSATFSSGSQYTITGIVSWTDLQKELPDLHMWSDPLLDTTPASSLHCVNTHQDCLIRWMSSPLWIGGEVSQMNGDKADAVLVIGDLVNSKTKIAETSNSIAGHGYSAMYFYNTTGQYQMANGLLRHDDDSLEVDVEMPETDWLEEGRLNNHFVDDDQATLSTYMKIQGDTHVVSARCITRNTVISSVGSLPYLTEWNGQTSGGCWCFLIQSIPVGSVIDPITDIPRSGLYMFLSVCVLKMIVMGSLCLAAYVPFHKIVMNKLVQGSKSKRGVTSPTKRTQEPTSQSPGMPPRLHTSRREVTQRRTQRSILSTRSTASKRVYIEPPEAIADPKAL